MNITSFLLCFFFIFMPELINAGKVFKAMPPLYLMDTKSLRRLYSGREWLYDKHEYYHMINSIIADNTEIAIELDNSNKRSKIPEVQNLNKREVMEFLMKNSEYKLELDNLGKKSACDTKVLEDVCFVKYRYPNPMDFKREIERTFPEMTYDPNNCSLIGSANGEYFTLICDSLFDRNARRFMDELRNNRSMYLWYRNKRNPNDKLTRVTIGEFLSDTERIFNVKIEERYKGLGEAETELLFRTTTNPKFRKLLKININDQKYTEEVFELLHGKSAKLREDRRRLIDSTKLSYADIDN